MASLSLSDKCFNVIRLWAPLTTENWLNMHIIVVQTIIDIFQTPLSVVGRGVYFCLDVLGMCFIKVRGKKKKNGSPYHQGRISVSLPK